MKKTLTTAQKEEKQAKIQDMQEKLDGFLKSALIDKGEMEKLTRHYRVSGLYNYSMVNSFMIAMQGGTICNSYKRWQALGRQVKKGEKAHISIWRPAKAKVIREDQETGEKKADYISTGKFFLSSVFDISQTEGEELRFDHNTEIPGADKAAAEKTAAALGFPVEYQAISDCRGFTDGKKIVVSALSNDVDAVKTIFHELGHCLLGSVGTHSISREQKEVEAESVGFLCLSFLGIDFDLSAAYVSAYRDGISKADTKGILKAAGKIINTIMAA